MFSLLRNRFGIPGVISVIALVFAMFGGAYAATNSGGGKATASAKAKKGPRGPKGPKGATGATGPAGPAGAAGPAGPKGDTGAKGDKGDTGSQGVQGPAGKDGTFSTEPLPQGETLTGVFAVKFAEGETVAVPISYPIQVSPSPTKVVWIFGPPADENALLINPATGAFEGLIEEDAEEVEASCPGSPTAPLAEPGLLCVYPSTEENASFNTGLFGAPALVTSPDPKSGALLSYQTVGGAGFVSGSWAVTAG